VNKEVGFQKEELLRKRSFSADELAEIKLPGLPGTPRALRDLAKAGDWPSIAVRSRGKGGLKYEYEPPPALLEAIRKHLRGEVVTLGEVAAARAVRMASQTQVQTGQSQEHSTLNTDGTYRNQVLEAVLLHDAGKVNPIFQKAVRRPRSGGQSVVREMTEAAHSADWLRGVTDQARITELVIRSISRLIDEGKRNRGEFLPILAADTEMLDATLRFEWALMRLEQTPSV
jgi:hypothetical protein